MGLKNFCEAELFGLKTFQFSRRYLLSQTDLNSFIACIACTCYFASMALFMLSFEGCYSPNAFCIRVGDSPPRIGYALFGVT